MRTSSFRLALIGTALICGAAGAADDRHPKAELAPVLGTWEFVAQVREKGAPSRTERFRLGAAPETTCMGGGWYHADRLVDGKPDGGPAAYTFENGKLKLMLDARICDAYTFFEGTAKADEFTGKLVNFGWGGGDQRGVVTGRRLR
jgi:hypothetical protein